MIEDNYSYIYESLLAKEGIYRVIIEALIENIYKAYKIKKSFQKMFLLPKK